MKSTHWLPIYGALLLTYFVENKGQRKVWGKSYWKSQRGSLFRTDTKQPLQTWPSIPAAVSFIPERLNGGYEKWRAAYISWPTSCNCFDWLVPTATLSVAAWLREARFVDYQWWPEQDQQFLFFNLFLDLRFYSLLSSGNKVTIN